MKKRMAKIFSLALAILMLGAIFSINAFASDEYGFSITCPQNYDESKGATFDGEGYFQSYYEEWAVAEDGSEYYTGNNVDIWVDLPLFYSELDIADSYNASSLEWVEDYVESFGEVTSSSYYYMNAGEFDAVAYDVYYHYHGTDENGKRVEYDGLYSEIILVCGAYEVTIDIDAYNAEDLLVKRNEMLETFADAIVYDAEVMAEIIDEEKTVLIIIGAILIGGFLIGVIVVVVIIVVVVKSSKKKKAQQPVYPYNNMNVPPQYYNPNGQVPYGNQNMNVPVQTPPSYVQPPVTTPPTTQENQENNTENLDN